MNRIISRRPPGARAVFTAAQSTATALALSFASMATGYPGGAPDLQTDVAPYCAACHASTREADLAGLGDRALAELPAATHFSAIQAGMGPYAALSAADRGRLVELLSAVDRNSTIMIEHPAWVQPGETFQVSVKVTGGGGPAVGIALVDRAHRIFARPASAVGWEVIGAPTIIGPKGPQTGWIERRPEREGRNITFVQVEGIASSAEEDRWARAKVVFTLKAPPEPGDYPLVGAYFYGTETGTALTRRIHPELGPQPLGGSAGRSGRIKFTQEALISVRNEDPAPPAATPGP